MRIPLDRQRVLYRQHARAAADELVQLLTRRVEALVELGADRAFDEVGVHQYGDRTYWLDAERLLAETEAELADAIFYMHIGLARSAGDLDAF